MGAYREGCICDGKKFSQFPPSGRHKGLRVKLIDELDINQRRVRSSFEIEIGKTVRSSRNVW